MKQKDEAAAFACALRILTRRDHSEQELFRKLSGKGHSFGAISASVVRLKELKYLDDRRFATRWVEEALAGQRFFGARLRMELVRRGIEPDLAAEVVAAATEAGNENEQLAELVARKFPGFDGAIATVGYQRRVYNFLLRKGFSSSAVIQFLRKRGA